jgi:hypothetical protein
MKYKLLFSTSVILAVFQGCGNVAYVSPLDQSEKTVSLPSLSNPTLQISASAVSINAGGSVLLSWNSTDATTCTASGGWAGNKNINGSEMVSPTQTTLFSLLCEGVSGSVIESVSVVVNAPIPAPAPTLALTASPMTITYGQSSTLQMNTTNATACTASANPAQAAWSGSVATSTSLVVSPGATTVYSVVCTGPGGSASRTITVTVNNPTVRIDCGATTGHTDSAGKVWAADSMFMNGFALDAGVINVAGTTDQILFRTQRKGDVNFSYNIPLPMGTYTVSLYFAETLNTGVAPGQRVFDVNIESTPSLGNFDIVVAAGAPFKAIVKSFNVMVVDGILNIDFLNKVNKSVVNGIEVVPN